jgi:hypothetical protein
MGPRQDVGEALSHRVMHSIVGCTCSVAATLQQVTVSYNMDPFLVNSCDYMCCIQFIAEVLHVLCK